MTTQKDIEAAIRHIKTSADIDPWAMELAVDALKAQMDKPMKLSTVCLLCKKPAVTFSTDDDIPYTNYSYCEDCLRKGLKLYKAQLSKESTTKDTISNAISRQAAMDALDDIESEVADGDGYKYEKWRKYFCELPSAQLERDIPKKPNETTDKTWGIPSKQAVCPNCNCFLGTIHFIGKGDKRKVTYCESCGQAIDWEGWDEDD